MDSLTTISPIDGRYNRDVQELSQFFSEYALIKYRLEIEIEYFIALSLEKNINELKPLSDSKQKKLRKIYEEFSLKDAKEIKKIEKTTNHDVKAVEYFLKSKLEGTAFKRAREFVHFALTSEDINNIAYALMWKDALFIAYIPVLEQTAGAISDFAQKYKNQPMLSLTHGQSATPTTIGKEFAVFARRLKRQADYLKKQKFQAKLSGATGTWSAHCIAYPAVNWTMFTQKFIKSFGLEPNLITTQIENHDSLAESYHTLSRVNTILLDFAKDAWFYISRGVLLQKASHGEIGSSTMPHKINPINFENAEGNLGIANAYLSHLSNKLPISRMQRDLSDSTVLRNQGVPLAHSLLASKNIIKGMEKITVNKENLNEELDANWEVLAEAIQTILRKTGRKKPYETLKKLTRGEKITKQSIEEFIHQLDLPEEEKEKLIKLTPKTYIGLANKLC